MNRVEIRASFVVLVLLLPVPTLFPTLALADHSAQATADRAVALISDGNLKAVSSLHHYPPTYSDQELLADKQTVTKGLALLVRRFGSISDAQPNDTLRYFYHVGSGGGTVEYWRSIPDSSVTNHVYDVHFGSVGDGFIKVDVVSIEEGSSPQIKAIEFGLPTERPGAKQQIVSTMKALLIELGVPLPENFIELAEQSMQAAGSVPASHQ